MNWLNKHSERLSQKPKSPLCGRSTILKSSRYRFVSGLTKNQKKRINRKAKKLVV